MTKMYSISLLALIAATPAFAGSSDPLLVGDVEIMSPDVPAFGGHITAYYGVSLVVDVTGNDEYHGTDFERIGVEGLVGRAGNGGFGWQLDGQYETASFTDTLGPVAERFADTYAVTAHGYFDLAGFSVGGFAGAGQGEYTSHNINASAYWYGLDAAKSFGDFAVSGQLGLATIDSEIPQLGSENQLFAAVEAHYFIGENLMIGANAGIGHGAVYDNNFTYTEWGVDATMRLGQSNFYATAGCFGSSVNLESYGTGLEQNFFAGVSILFGGGLREVYAGSTPMVGQSMIPYIAILSGVNND